MNKRYYFKETENRHKQQNTRETIMKHQIYQTCIFSKKRNKKEIGIKR